MKYNKNGYSTEQQNSQNLFSLVKAVGILSVAYLAYCKRDKINQGYVHAKDSCNKMVEPIAEGIKKTTHNVQDFISHKKEDATLAITGLGSQIENKYSQLQGDAKDTYKNQLISLREKLDALIDKADDNTHDSDKKQVNNNGEKKDLDSNDSHNDNHIRDLNNLGPKKEVSKEYNQ